MNATRVIDQLKAMPPETQAAPEFQRLLARLESPPRPGNIEEVSNVMKADVGGAAKPVSKIKRCCWWRENPSPR
jgi:hypothetical protein